MKLNTSLMNGYSYKNIISLVTDKELKNPCFVRDLLTYAQELRITPSGWRNYLTNAYAQFEGVIIDQQGSEIYLNMDLFEVEDELLFADNSYSAKQVAIANEAIRGWFDYWLCSPKKQEIINFSVLTQERLRVVATILKAAFPQEAQFWGLEGKAVNDN